MGKRIIGRNSLIAVLMILCIFIQTNFAASAKMPTNDPTAAEMPMNDPAAAKMSTDVPIEPENGQEQAYSFISAEYMAFERLSSTEINIAWIDNTGLPVQRYVLQKRGTQNNVGVGEWSEVGTVEAGSTIPGQCVFMIDHLKDSAPQQYEYRVIMETLGAVPYAMPEKTSILASNIMVCIDPGHFAGRNAILGTRSYQYVEGNYTLKIAISLYTILKKEYGIDAYLTRTGGSITIDGYTDAGLDDAHIKLRGRYAAVKNSDLFVSLHTDGNGDNANGFDTVQQPKAINKTTIIVNMPAVNMEMPLKAANSIGAGLTRLNYQLGLSSFCSFVGAGVGMVTPWTESHHDSLNIPGAVIYHTNSRGQDYYGVLRGAAEVGVPGMIIEHAFHTVYEVRREAMTTNLYEKWARVDAHGIAYGFGFVDEPFLSGQ